jgi:hypothetical protein
MFQTCGKKEITVSIAYIAWEMTGVLRSFLAAPCVDLARAV